MRPRAGRNLEFPVLYTVRLRNILLQSINIAYENLLWIVRIKVDLYWYAGTLPIERI